MTITIKGILTDCVDNTSKEVDVVVEIKEGERKIFEIVEGGVTGYESFYVDHVGLPKELSRFETNLEEFKKRGWLACAGTKNKWDKLFIPGTEMKKALEALL